LGLQVSIKFVVFAVDFVLFATEFKFIGFLIEFILEFVMFAQEFVTMTLPIYFTLSNLRSKELHACMGYILYVA